MGKKILVTYATGAGSTTGVAEAIGTTLQSVGAEVEVRHAKEVTDVSCYQAVVIGSGIRAGHIYGDMLKFLKQHATALRNVPVAYFVVCLTMNEPTEEHCKEVNAYLDPVRENFPDIKPVDVGLFAGEMDFKKLALPIRALIKAMKSPEGDFRDWDAIRAWAEDIAPQLLT